MGQDLIRYDVLAQEALRGVIRKVIGEVVKTGLPGEHHFFITFLTSAPGVRISSRLREKYPELMTIVIQHQYWDLQVTDTTFEVGLSFSDIPERLLIPFAAIRGFYDPAVNFELEFDVRGIDAANEQLDAPEEGESHGPVLVGSPTQITPAKAATKPKGKKSPKDKPKTTTESEEAGDEAPEKKDADVVSLDAFRKKT
ncbi:SspB family protein [Aurantimonas sp. C2-6-R+9]|uniref:SspB family protein n=1 Tax=unclassified Aurantimonas TaxID=2638230 RepID=UPI002E17511E|nr:MULTISPECIES: SspB family protein [unclassified Aurantimonas]MEC5292651.1 SspB family protein [Aurantimonas sp. C2-3-R2]MEC5382871.1 SspB family protein [Aurantimonas sp. C2-6-R+9]MEC5413796.1 SspB family protein [Aurantimonas sp. C2-4-R8]